MCFAKWFRRSLLLANLAAPVAMLATRFQMPWVIIGSAVVHALLIYALVVPQCAWLGPVVTRFIPAGRDVWLTIDDGPFGNETRHLATEMAERGVRATFFVTGTNLARHPGLAAELEGIGHSMSNHTNSHPAFHFWWLLPQRLHREIRLCNEALASAGVRVQRWFRSPVGLKHALLHRFLAKEGMRLVAWNVRGCDGIISDPKAVVERVVKKVKPGSIVLLHEGRARSVETILAVIDALQAMGYRFVIPEDGQLR